jgi:hypothetical protein
LLEPQRTNLVTFSESFNNAAYTKTNVSVTANNTISPDGYINADKLVENTSNAIHGVRAVIASSINPFTFSVFAKSFSGNRYLQLRMANDVSGSIVALFDLDNGTIIIDTTLYGGGYSVLPSKIISLGNGWYKCSISGNKTDNVGNNNVEINLSSTTTPAEVYSYTGNGTSGVFVYGAQLEAGAASTSYIPTLAASVTRVADAASKTGISSLIGQTEGVLYVDFVPQNNPIASTPQWLMFLGSVSTYISIFLSNGGKIRANVADTTDQCVIDTSYNFVAGTRYKCALAYKANDFAFYVNGALVGTDTSGTVPAVSTLQNNYNTTAANGTNAGLNQMLLFKTRLTNAQLAELTTL